MYLFHFIRSFYVLFFFGEMNVAWIVVIFNWLELDIGARRRMRSEKWSNEENRQTSLAWISAINAGLRMSDQQTFRLLLLHIRFRRVFVSVCVCLIFPPVRGFNYALNSTTFLYFGVTSKGPDLDHRQAIISESVPPLPPTPFAVVADMNKKLSLSSEKE